MSEPVFPWNEIERLKEEFSTEKDFYESMRYKLNDSIDNLSLGSEEDWESFQIAINALLDMAFENFEGGEINGSN